MQPGNRIKKYENHIIAAAVLAVILLIAGLGFEHYYDLNDDVLMKDILSGRYTGTPAGHNIQMHYPLSLLLSLFYRLMPALPWYGLFLCLCQYGSLYLLVERSLRFCSRSLYKWLLAAAELLVLLQLLLYHLVFVQYTVTCGLLAAAAVMWFATADERSFKRPESLTGEADNAAKRDGFEGRTGRSERKAGFLRANLPAVFLLFLGFLLRSEMMLLMLPFVGAAGVFSWSLEERALSFGTIKKYLSVAGVLILALVLGQGLHLAGYADGAWQDFMDFFDARTEIYDFSGIPSYEENQVFYEEIVGLSEPEWQLLVNYNFGLDEKIDTGRMKQIRDHAVALEKAKDQGKKRAESLWLYRYRLLHNVQDGPRWDMPFNMALLCFYLLALSAGLAAGKCRVLWQLFLLFAGRSAVWLFLMLRGRDPERITHPLYLMEMVVLAVLLGWYLQPAERSRKGLLAKVPARFWLGAAVAACLAVKLCMLGQSGGITGSFSQWTAAFKESGRREEVNLVYQDMMALCKQHPERFYFADVYSTVDFSEKIFQDVDNDPVNYDLLGGWCSKSPLTAQKLEYFGLPDPQEALLLEQVYLFQEKDEDTDWLREYYAGQGIQIEIELTDILRDAMCVYKIRAAG